MEREPRKLKPPYNDIILRQGELGAQLKMMRRDVGISIEKLAELTELSTKTIWKLEKGLNTKVESLLRVMESLRYELFFRQIEPEEGEIIRFA